MFSFLFFLRFYSFIFRERGREGEREGEKHQCVVASYASPIGDLACNPRMCPDWESNQWPFGSQASTQSTDPHQPELLFLIKDANYVPTQKLLLKINSQKVNCKTSDVLFTNRTYHLKREGKNTDRNLYNHVIVTAWNSSASIDQEARNGKGGGEWWPAFLTHEQLRVYKYHWFKCVIYINQLK